MTRSRKKLGLKFLPKTNTKLEPGRKFIMPRTETGQPITLNSCLVKIALIQTGNKCTKSWKIFGKSMENNTALKINTLLLSKSPSVRLAKNQVK